MQAMINKAHIVNIAIGGLLAAVASGVANAVPIIDIVDPQENIEVSVTNPEYIFTHDITDDFAPLIDFIDYAAISINFIDNHGSESIVITIDELVATTIQNIGSRRNYSALIPSIADLQQDGLLDIQLTTESRRGKTGNFFFVDSTLTAQVTKGDSNDDVVTNRASVPEPTTLALLSLGLAGLGFTRRKKKA
jgi:hypothetical protein